jgi:hypothetical protein
LIEIEMMLQENGWSLTDFKSMPRPNAADMPTFTNKLIIDDLNYNKDELEKTHADMLLMNKDVCMTRSWSMFVLTTVVSFSYMVRWYWKNLYMENIVGYC